MFHLYNFKMLWLKFLLIIPIQRLSGGYSSGGYENTNNGGGGYEYYDHSKYKYLPAPPGKTPQCARNGATYCEKVDNYPHEVINSLLYRFSYTYSQFIKSELNQEFIMMVQNNSYGPYGPYSPREKHVYGSSSNHHGYDYTPVSKNPFLLEPTSSSTIYHNQHQQLNDPYTAAAVIIPPIVHSIWWNHRDKTTNRPTFHYLPQNNNRFQHRVQKRQTAFDQALIDDRQLCPIRSSYISPRAAMNNEGNWMYVVNSGNTRFEQQVRTEICADTDGGRCSQCQPPGMTARCRQKYVQKKLVALDGSGSNLRNEVFWFPHCCVCEIF